MVAIIVIGITNVYNQSKYLQNPKEKQVYIRCTI